MVDIKTRALERVQALMAKVMSSFDSEGKASDEGRTFAVVVVKIIVKHDLFFFIPSVEDLLSKVPSEPDPEDVARTFASLSPEEFEKLFDMVMVEAKRRVSDKRQEKR